MSCNISSENFVLPQVNNTSELMIFYILITCLLDVEVYLLCFLNFISSLGAASLRHAYNFIQANEVLNVIVNTSGCLVCLGGGLTCDDLASHPGEGW